MSFTVISDNDNIIDYHKLHLLNLHTFTTTSDTPSTAESDTWIDWWSMCKIDYSILSANSDTFSDSSNIYNKYIT